MEQFKREVARSKGHLRRFVHHLSVSLFAGIALLTFSAFFGIPISFTGGSTSCLFVASEYQCAVPSPMLVVFDYLFWALAALAALSVSEVALTRRYSR
jgi:hypothetical protein